MEKKNRIYEKKEDKRKSKVTSIRMTEKVAKEIAAKAEQCDMNQNDYIISACLNAPIVIVPEGKKILQNIQEIRQHLYTISPNRTIDEINFYLTQMAIHLRNIIEDYSNYYSNGR